MSYRIIFGQDSRSRHIFMKAYGKDLKQQQRSLDSLTELLLLELCGKEWTAVPLYVQINSPREKTQYSVQQDFRFLRERLVDLQRFVFDQNPSDLRALMHDRRDVCEFSCRFYHVKTNLALGSTILYLLDRCDSWWDWPHRRTHSNHCWYTTDSLEIDEMIVSTQ